MFSSYDGRFFKKTRLKKKKVYFNGFTHLSQKWGEFGIILISGNFVFKKQMPPNN